MAIGVVAAMSAGSSCKQASGSGSGGGADTAADTIAEASALPGYERAYRALLSEAKQCIGSGAEGSAAVEGIVSAAAGKTPEEALQALGYAITDVSGDSIPELIIGAVAKNPHTAVVGNELYAVYAYADGRARLILSGNARNPYYMRQYGDFIHEGSEGAGCSFFGIYMLDSTATQVTCIDFSFTSYEADGVTQAVYFNESSVCDVAASTRSGLTIDEYWNMVSEQEGVTQLVELTPLADLK